MGENLTGMDSRFDVFTVQKICKKKWYDRQKSYELAVETTTLFFLSRPK